MECPDRMVACLLMWALLGGAVATACLAAPVPLTRGPGDDTEAAWSPNGRSLVFQRSLNGDINLLVLDVKSGAVKPLVTGPGEAIYPAWAPDGRSVVYSFAHFAQTVAQGQERGFNLMLVPAAGGTGTPACPPRRLTDGLVRDYLPAFTPDGRTLYFSSTRGFGQSAVGIFRCPLPAAGAPLPTPERVIARDSDDCAAVQPSVSPDGRLLAFGMIRGMRSNWTIMLAKTAQPEKTFPLTDSSWSCYGPRWSPEGRWLACTGYRAGDPGWGVYVVDAQTGGALRLDTGPGSSRSPAWAPDGKQLVFENNRTGSYKLYRFSPQLPARLANTETAEEQAGPILKLSFADLAGGSVKDQSGVGNDARIVGTVTPTEGGVTFGADGYLTVPQPRGSDFGRRSLSVRAELMVERHTQSLRMIAVGDYPICQRGWQLYIDDSDHLWFSARTTAQLFIGARSDAPLPVGKRVTVVGSRDRMGLVELHVDGAPQAIVCNGADMSYPPATQIRLGRQYDGTMPATGVRLYGVEIAPMLLMRGPGVAASLEEFLRP